jgi:hypothetical protein
MKYESWRATHQSSEQAARAAFETDLELQKECAELKAHVERFRSAVFHFNQSHGDINPLLKAACEAPKKSLAKRDSQIKSDAAYNGIFTVVEFMKDTWPEWWEKTGRHDKQVREFVMYANTFFKHGHIPNEIKGSL